MQQQQFMSPSPQVEGNQEIDEQNKHLQLHKITTKKTSCLKKKWSWMPSSAVTGQLFKQAAVQHRAHPGYAVHGQS